MSSELLPELIDRLGTLGVIVFAAWVMLKHILNEQRKSAAEHTLALKSITKSLSVQSAAIAAMHTSFIHHDLTVRGLNPTTGQDMNERAEIALAAYKENQKALAEIIRMLQERAVQ